MSRPLCVAAAILFVVWAPGSSIAQDKLKGIVGRHLEKVEGYLEKSEQALAANNLRDAKMLLGEAETHWKTFSEWNAGKYDPNHQQVVAAARHIEELRAKVKGESDTTAAQGASLKVIVKIISESKDRLEKVNDESRRLLREYSSTKSDFDMGRADLKKLREKMEGLRTIIGRFNDLLPPARAAAAEFRKQFPNKQELSQRFGRDGYLAFDAAERVASFPDIWLTELKSLVDDALKTATENISQAESKLAGAGEQHEALHQSIAESAEKWALGFADLLLEFANIAFPELSDEAKKVVPEFVKAREEYLARIGPLRKRIDAIDVGIRKLRKQVVAADARRAAAARRRLEATRFPKSEYTGGEWDAVARAMRKLWTDANADKQLLRLSISSPWDERNEARWRRDHVWVSGTYRYIDAFFLAKLGNGEHYYYLSTFRKKRQSDGSWSELKHRGTGWGQRILTENIDK